ncbi:MAG: bifunctional diaminohydroxyphosphoribosylaminopyrimidine deaminase/5-amino-6-(5-phosphoribosylamino)uracil reductase RibD [Gemmobacter sp.]
MALALALGRRGLGAVWPNPAVGCVIVRDGRIVGRGSTAPGGRPHAETVALDQAGAAARGGTAYVSLEPCAHHGRTPPCTDALIAAGIARVVTSIEDPDPRVAGGGHARLRAAGIAVTTGVRAAEARHDHAGFLMRVAQGRPMLTLKLAMTLDGAIATGAGESRWITGPAARACVHLSRACHDAVLVGAGTARSDDPELTVRGLGIDRRPVAIVLSQRLDLPRTGRLAARAAGLWLLHGAEAPQDHVAFWQGVGARLIRIGSMPDGGLDPAEALHRLGAAGLTRVFCEGGGAVAAALLRADLVDRVEIYSAGMALGADGRRAIGALGLGSLDAAVRFELRDAVQVGDDLLHRWVRRGRA